MNLIEERKKRSNNETERTIHDKKEDGETKERKNKDMQQTGRKKKTRTDQHQLVGCMRLYNGCNQNDFFFLLVIPNFMIAKYLLDVNMKCLFCGEFC